MIGLLTKRLANKILVAIVITIVLIMGTEIVVRIYFGTKDRVELMNMLARDLASSTYAGIKHPMAVGDAKAIKKALLDIRQTADDVEVLICDFEQEIVYATHEEKLHTKLADFIGNPDALQSLKRILKTGIQPENPFEEKVGGERYLVSFYPVLNQKECYHCHGSSRQVLGSMAIKVSAEKAYRTVAAQRNRTLLLTLFGIFLSITIIYLIVNKFIRHPVENLAEKAKRFAEGDMSVSIEIKTDDEIGVLGKTFNDMVESVSLSSRKLEEGISRKSDLLSERTRLITLLEKANRQLRELDKLKSTFLANMSHELRTPMNAIIGYTDLLIDGVDGPVNKEQKKNLQKIASNSRHLLQLINDVLDISKIESGKATLTPQALDPKWVIESVIPTFEPVIKKKGLVMTHNIDEDLPLIYGDEDMIKKILINLLSNAVKFTHKGGITITAKTSERGIQPGEEPIFAEICVEDTGIGIKDEDLGTVFDKFVQVDLTTVRQYEGTGLGLSIARALVALHKGMLWAKSQYGGGSKFCFTIPLKKEMLEEPEEPVVEPRMADAMAQYFGKPIETFLKKPQYGGEPVRCWEYVRCGQPSCPAYESRESRCWLILGTHCAGMKVAAYPEKVDFCKGCELIEGLVLKADEAYKPAETESPPGKGDAKRTVLAIDDDPQGIDIIRKYLGEEYRVVGLLSGKEAVEKAKEINPLAVTLDILMPKKDGWTVLRELKETPETQDIPVIVLSIIDDKKLGFSLGATEYMVKPVNKQVLFRKLRNLEKMGKIKRVLVVDHEPETVRLIGNALREAGYQVTTGYNSKDAIKSIQALRPDLVVLNLTMPEVSGFDVIEYLKTEENVRDIPLIVLTHKDLTEKEIDTLNGRIQGILNKGVLTKEDLLIELRNTMNKVSKLQ